MPDHVGPRRHPAWVEVPTQVVMFALGVLCILYPIVHRGAHTVAYLVTGLVLLGIVRLSDLIPPRQTPRRQPKGRHIMTDTTPAPDPNDDDDRERRRDDVGTGAPVEDDDDTPTEADTGGAGNETSTPPPA